jgi:gluconolactonase
MADREVVADSLSVPEGPVLLPDGRIAFVELTAARVSTYGAGGVGVLTRHAGSWNGLALGNDGCVYAAQNGGVAGSLRALEPTTPGIERTTLSGVVDTVVIEVEGRPLKAPNDVTFGPDGRLWFTDSGEAFNLDHPSRGSRILAVGGGDGEVVVTLPPVYANGLGFLIDGRLAWVESYERHLCVLENGARRVLCQLPDGHRPDGFAVATDGRIFIATVVSHGITVVSPQGELLDHLVLDDRALPSNCCFDGSDLWVTDFGVGWQSGTPTGRLWRVETDTSGQPLGSGRL